MKSIWSKLEPPERRFVLIIWLLALALRVGYAFTVDLIPANYLGIDMDAVEYDWLGWSIAQGRGVVTPYGDPTSIRFPGYLYFLGLIYFLFGHHHIAVLLAQALMGSLTPILIYLTARQLFSLRVSRIAAAVGAIYPGFVYFVGWMMTENLFILWVSLLLYLTVSLKDGASIRKLAVMGVLLGLLGLTRGMGIPFIGLIPLYILLRLHGRFQERLAKAALVFVVACLTLIPWTWRNYVIFHRLMLPSSEGGIVLWLGFHNIPLTHYETQEAYAYVDSVGWERAKSEEFYRLLAVNNYSGLAAVQWVFELYYPQESRPQSEPEGSERLGRKAMALLLQNPKVWVVKSIKQVFRFWHVLDERGRFVNGYAFILPFFLAGFWLLRSRIGELLPLYLYMMVLYAMAIIFSADARFRLPFEGVLIIVGAWGIERFLSLFRRIYWGYSILAVFFLFGFYLRLHSLQVRLALRSIAGALGFQLIEMQ